MREIPPSWPAVFAALDRYRLPLAEMRGGHFLVRHTAERHGIKKGKQVRFWWCSETDQPRRLPAALLYILRPLYVIGAESVTLIEPSVRDEQTQDVPIGHVGHFQEFPVTTESLASAIAHQRTLGLAQVSPSSTGVRRPRC